MELPLEIAIGTLGTWITLIIVVPIAGRLAQFSFPGWGTALWKLAVIALVTNAVTVVLALASGWLGWIGGVVVFWVLMVKWFDVDVFGAVIIVVISWFVRLFLVGALIGLLVSAA